MILNNNSTQQINTLVIQLQNKITNLTNEFRKLNNNIDDLNSEISDLEKRVSSNENDADNNIDGLDSKISDLEKRVSSNENAAAAMNAEISANTEAISDKADKIHTHTKSQITDFPTSLPANGGTASSCSGNSATATQLQTARTINIQDSSATYTGTGASFNGSGDATIKLPSTIKANEFKIGDGEQSIAYRSKSYNGFKMHDVQVKALYIEGRESDMGDSGGLAITNDSVTVFGAGDTNGVFRVVNEDNAGDGSKTAPAIFNIFKGGNVTMTGRLTAPSATIGDRPVITGTYSASDGILNLYTN